MGYKLKHAWFWVVLFFANGLYGDDQPRADTIVISRDHEGSGLLLTGDVRRPPTPDHRHFRQSAMGPTRLAWRTGRMLRAVGISCLDAQMVDRLSSIPGDWKSVVKGEILCAPARA